MIMVENIWFVYNDKVFFEDIDKLIQYFSLVYHCKEIMLAK